MIKNIVVFVSGNGTNLQALIDAEKQLILPIKIRGVVCNNPNAYAIERCKQNDIEIFVLERKKQQPRQEFETLIIEYMKNLEFDFIVFAGWMHICSQYFIEKMECPIINLHPALPGTFPGAHGIKDAYNAYKQNKISHTGAMVHYVIPEIDAGELIESVNIPIYEFDTLETLENRVHFYEKPLLVKSVGTVCSKMTKLIYRGKVRDIYDIGKKGKIAIRATNRLSAFDRQICLIPGKGKILNNISVKWFGLTKHIVPNHFVKCISDDTMICKKAKRFDIEFVVRQYITGTTSTALWTHYSAGERVYCGITFPDGLVKNQKLSEPVFTPTTKSEKDELISLDQIVERKIMTREQVEYVKTKALELFKFGSEFTKNRGLILVDTKYEFGIDEETNEIILIDEVHTCDSSRYWLLNTYEERFKSGLNPESLDKDMIRNYISEICNPYVDNLPEIPEELIQQVSRTYEKFYNLLTI